MPPSHGRSVAIAVFVFVLTFSPYAHAAETSAFGINDPFTDAIQLWSAALSSIDSLAHQLASALQLHQTLTFNATAKPHAPKNLQQPAALAASAALATQSPPETATTSGSESDGATTPQQPQTTSPPKATSDQTTSSPFVKSAVSAPLASNQTIQSPFVKSPDFSPNSPASDPALAAATPASAFVTQAQFNAAMSALGTSVRQLLTHSNPNPVPEYVGGDGNNGDPYAAVSNIGQLSNVTITNSTITGLTAGEIPDLSGSYLSLGGGTLTGAFADSGTASSSFAGALGIGTTSPSDVLAVNGPVFLGSVSPAATADRLYNNGGSLYWAGSPIAGGSVGNWTTDGTNVWRTGGNVGIGTTTPGSLFSVQGVANFTTATSTYYSTGGINLTAGCFAIGGNCLGLGSFSGTLAVIQGGTGTTTWQTGSIPFYNGSSFTESNSMLSFNGSILVANGGFTGYASSTVGNGNQNGGLTISGGATTTGTAYFGGSIDLGANGNALINSQLDDQGAYQIYTFGNGALGSLIYNSATDCCAMAFGYDALASATTTDHDIAFGDHALQSVTYLGHNEGIGIDTMRLSTNPGTENLAVGEQALDEGPSPNYDTAIGQGAMSWAGGSYNLGLGYSSLFSSSTNPLSGSYNTAIGPFALTSLAGNTPSDDTAVGFRALDNTTTGVSNTAIGQQTGGAVTTGQFDTFIGQAVGYTTPTTGSDDILIGYDSSSRTATGGSSGAIGIGPATNPGSSDIAIGNGALHGTTGDSQDNIGVGYQAGYSITSGVHNEIYGFNCGTAITTGGFNTILGDSCGDTLTTGSGNILIGHSANVAASTTSNFLDIGSTIYGTNLGSSGNIGIGTTTPYSRLTIWGPDTSAGTSAFVIANSASTTEFNVLDNGNATLAGTLTQNSDQRLKTNIQSLDASSSLAAIDAINPVTFNWIDLSQGSTTQLGFIAQQMQQIFPNLVATTSPTALTPNGTLSVNYIGLISPIVAAIQALSAELTSIENTIAGLADAITTKLLTANSIQTQQLCVGSTCVTPAQFQAMLAAANQSSGSSTPPPPSSDGAAASSSTDSSATPPVLQVNGDNPAIIQVGATYTDLGATIEGPQADLNLGITTYVNGAPMNPVQIDTSTVATDTIAYVATDSVGLSSTSTRTVIIEAADAPSIVPSAAASTTDATSTAQ